MQPDMAGPQTEEALEQSPTAHAAESGLSRSEPPDIQRVATVFDAAQREVLRAVLNRIVPAHDEVPGAGDLEVGGTIERTLKESARLRRLFLEGLGEIAITAQQQMGSGFLELDPARQTQVIESVEQTTPAFVVALVQHTYRGYYTLPEVQRAVGWEPRPPQPLGYELPHFDPSLLDAQRRRAPFWRRADNAGQSAR
jgi:hypothetical protein